MSKLPLSLLIAGARALSTNALSLPSLALVAASALCMPTQAAAAVDPNGFVQIEYSTNQLTDTQKVEIEKAVNYLNSIIVGNASGTSGQVTVTVYTYNSDDGTAGTGGVRTTATSNGYTYSTSGVYNINLNVYGNGATDYLKWTSLHEICHALGLPGLWAPNNLRASSSEDDSGYFEYIGKNGLLAWQLEFERAYDSYVPVMSGGMGDGAHWAANLAYTSIFSGYDFSSEVMTYGNHEFLSNVTIGTLVDMGYKIAAPSANSDGVYLIDTEFLTPDIEATNDFNYLGVSEKGTVIWGQLTGANSLVVNVAEEAVIAIMGANTYTGGTTLEAGTLVAGNSAAFARGAFAMSGGTLDVFGTDVVVSRLTMTGGIITNGLYEAQGTGSLVVSSSMDLRAGEVQATLAGGGSLVKTTAGTVTLSAANTFTGATTISGGTLAIAHADALAKSSTITINGGTLNVLDSAMVTSGRIVLSSGLITGSGGTVSASSYTLESGTISATLTGSGSMTKTTEGTVTLSAANTFTGGVRVTNGTLIGSAADSLGAGTVTLSGGTLRLANARAAQNASIVASGGEISFGGLSSATIGSLSGTADLALDSFTLAVGNNDTSTTYSGVLSGSGSLRKIGTGDFILTADNTYTGGTTVTNGTLTLGAAASLGSGNVTVNGGTLKIADAATFQNGITITSGGSLETAGTSGKTITAPSITVNNAGILNPGGASTVTLNIDGDLTMHGGTLQLDITTGNNDKLIITGTTHIANGAIALTSNVAPQVGDIGTTRITVIESAGGFDGRINTVTGTNNTYTERAAPGGEIYQVPIGYKFIQSDETTGQLVAGYDYASSKFIDLLTENERQIGYVLNDMEAAEVATTGTTTDNPLLLAISEIIEIDSLKTAYEELMPVNLMTVSRSAIKQATALTTTFDRRSRDMRRGAIQPGSIWTKYLFEENYGFNFTAQPLVASTGMGFVPYTGHNEEFPLTLWMNGGASYWKGDRVGSTPSTKSTQYTGTLGIDYRWVSGLGNKATTYDLGVLINYNNTTDKIGSSGSRNELDAIAFATYLTVTRNGFYFNALGAYAINSYDFKREINIAGLESIAKGKPDGAQYIGYLGGGYEWEFRDWAHGPTVTLQYSKTKIDGYDENGAGDLNLSTGDQDYDSLVASIGYRVSTRVKTNFATLLPEIRASWNHEFMDDSQDITSTMGSSLPFTVKTADGGRNYFTVGVGLTMLLSETVSLSMDYDATLGQKDMDPQHTVNAMLRVSF